MAMTRGEVDVLMGELESAAQSYTEIRSKLREGIPSFFVDALEAEYKKSGTDKTFDAWLPSVQDVEYEPMGACGPDLLRVTYVSRLKEDDEGTLSDLQVFMHYQKRNNLGESYWSERVNEELQQRGYLVRFKPLFDYTYTLLR